MRQRVELLGGAIEVGPTGDGGRCAPRYLCKGAIGLAPAVTAQALQRGLVGQVEHHVGKAEQEVQDKQNHPGKHQ